MAESRLPFIAYAHEAQVGDVVDGYTVTAKSEDGEQVTLSRTGVADKTYAREDEVSVRRLESEMRYGTSEALALLAAAPKDPNAVDAA